MPSNADLDPQLRLPRFLTDTDEPEPQLEPGIGNALSRAAVATRVLKVIAWAAVPIGLGIALLSMEAPARLVGELTASITDSANALLNPPAAQPDTDKSLPVIRYAAAGDPTLPQLAEPPSGEVVGAVPEKSAEHQAADRREAANGETGSENLLGQFQAWASDKEKPADPEPAPAVQAAPVPAVTQAAPEAPAQAAATDGNEAVRPAQKRRQARALHTARAEMRPAHLRRHKVAREHAPRPPGPVPQEARAQVEAVQPAQPQVFQAPSLFQTLGFGNASTQ